MADYKFPLDIDQSLAHCMRISAYKSGENKTASAQDTFTLYMPGGPPGGVLTWETALDYEDVKIAHVVGGQVAAIASGLGSMAGGVINPKVEVLFRNVELRKFQFNFLFAPVSEQESQQLKDIVMNLRAHASPEIVGGNDPRQSYIGLGNQYSYLSSGGLVLSPSEFLIDFLFKSSNTGSWQDNTAIPKIGRCVIERIDIDYANSNGTGEFSTFSNGHPVAVALTVVFREMRIIDNKNILGGY